MEPDGGTGLLEEARREAWEGPPVPDADLWPVAADAIVLTEPSKRDKVHGLVVRPRRLEEIARDLRPHRAVIHDDGVIWTLIPKRSAMEALSVDVNPEDLLEIALRTDLVDNKTRAVLRDGIRRSVCRLQAPPPRLSRVGLRG